MKPVLTPEQAAALDAAAEARGIPTIALMERAGWHVARAAADLLGGTYGRRVVVVAGKGNNGGDGLVAARYLDAWGARVSVHLLAHPGDLRGPAAANHDRLAAETGVVVRPFSADELERDLGRADLVVDAIFGTGFRGSAEGDPATAIARLGASDQPVVAVDVPSGVNAATGAVDGPAVVAEVTVAFGALKPGLVLHPGAAHAGATIVVDIGFPPDLVSSDLALVEAADVRLPARAEDAHKRSTGVVLVVGGSRDMTGAPGLTALGAYRAGAGLVGLATVESRLAVLQGRVPEAVFMGLPETDGGTVAAGAADQILDGLERYHVLALGPGLSTEPETAGAVRRLALEARTPLVLDADGLNAFSGRAADLASRRAPTVLTPHAGEMARLLDASPADVGAGRIEAARKLAATTGAVVLAKGRPTVVVAPDGEARVNPTGGPSLATGGTGDVLTGVVAAYVARGMHPFDAATAAAYVHGVAGDLAGLDLGEGTVATDVAERLPEAAGLLRA